MKATLRYQLDLMNEIRDNLNINIVTCGNCGEVIMHKRLTNIIDCHSCDSEMDECDCPDLFYNGMERLDN